MGFRRFVAARLALVMLASSSCASPGALQLQVSEHFRTARGAFMVDVSSGSVRYVLAYEVLAPFSEPVIARIHFQNPRAAQPDYVVERLLLPDDHRLDVQSPPLIGMAAGSYRVLLVAIHAATGAELTRHVQTLRFAIAGGVVPPPRAP
jgi:hypothetical protein